MSKESRQFKVPDALANLYDFANTLDERCFTHHQVPHQPGDDLTRPQDLAAWLSARGLMTSGATITPAMLAAALRLRACVRSFLQAETDARRSNKALLRALNDATRPFPLLSEARVGGGMTLRPLRDDALAGLSTVVADMHAAAASGELDRLKMCASEDCRRVFFDRSKPGTRRWCLSTLCGNRMKTRTYRERHQG